MKLTRDQTIEDLVKNNVDNVVQSAFSGDTEYLSTIFTEGFIGYSYYKDEELRKEYEDIFNEKLQIVED